MDVWNEYQSRLNARGATKRGTVLKRGQRALALKLSSSLSYQSVKIDGAAQDVVIIGSDNLNEKMMYSLKSGAFTCGSLVEWEENHWLITELDAQDEFYTRAKLLQCNHLLKWVDDENIIREQWCVVSDGTKYLTGEYEDQHYIVTRGDARLSMTIGRNEHTVKFGRNTRFLIDDPLSKHKMAFLLTKPFKVGMTYNAAGVFSFVLSECDTEDTDNEELGIADYYKHFPRTPLDTAAKPADVPSPDPDESGKKVWL